MKLGDRVRFRNGDEWLEGKIVEFYTNVFAKAENTKKRVLVKSGRVIYARAVTLIRRIDD